MSGSFQKRAFQFLAYQVGRLFPRQISFTARAVPRADIDLAQRGPTCVLAARGPDVDLLPRVRARAHPRVRVQLSRRDLSIRARAERRTP